MDKIELIRARIDRLDAEIAKLFEERMRESRHVAEYKQANGLSILNAAREEELLRRNTEHIEDNEIREYYINFQRNVMSLSRDYQSRLMEGMKVAYCGLPGAFAYIAASRMFNGARLLSYPSFKDAYEACEKGDCDSVVLPLENSFAGEVSDVADLMFSGSLYVNQVIEIEAVQNLIAIEGASLDSIKEVVSHPQAISQCADYLSKRGYNVSNYPNTASAAKMVADKKDPSIAAIASRECAELYGLKVIENHINTSGNNTTRFAAFSKVRNSSASKGRHNSHFILMFTVKNEAGALAKALNIIGAHGFNMSSLRSRPMKGLLWKYYFYVELEGKLNNEEWEWLIRELGTICEQFKLLGAF